MSASQVACWPASQPWSVSRSYCAVCAPCSRCTARRTSARALPFASAVFALSASLQAMSRCRCSWLRRRADSFGASVSHCAPTTVSHSPLLFAVAGVAIVAGHAAAGPPEVNVPVWPDPSPRKARRHSATIELQPFVARLPDPGNLGWTHDAAPLKTAVKLRLRSGIEKCVSAPKVAPRGTRPRKAAHVSAWHATGAGAPRPRRRGLGRRALGRCALHRLDDGRGLGPSSASAASGAPTRRPAAGSRAASAVRARLRRVPPPPRRRGRRRSATGRAPAPRPAAGRASARARAAADPRARRAGSGRHRRPRSSRRCRRAPRQRLPMRRRPRRRGRGPRRSRGRASARGRSGRPARAAGRGVRASAGRASTRGPSRRARQAGHSPPSWLPPHAQRWSATAITTGRSVRPRAPTSAATRSGGLDRCRASARATSARTSSAASASARRRRRARPRRSSTVIARRHAQPPISASISGFSSFTYSLRAALARCRMRTGSPASAARNAALSAIVADAAAGDAQPRERRRRRGRRSASARGRRAARSRARCARVGERERDDEAQPPQERGVERLLHVRRQDREAAVGLHALQQVADLDVGVAVVAVLDLGPLAEERVRLVEEQDRAARLGRVEDPPQVLLRLADVLADDLAEVDAVEVEVELARRAPRRPSSCRCRSRRRRAR